MAKFLEIRQRKSESKLKPKQKATLRALGLKGLGSVAHRSDYRAIRGMMNHLHHIIEAKQVDQRVESKGIKKKAAPNRGVKIL